MLEKCCNCSAADFKRMADGRMRCSYCRLVFVMKEKFRNVTINNDMSKGWKFIVHDKLSIKGDMNRLEIMLLDGASIEDIGDMNIISY